ncbi:MAG: flagellar hook-basal body protein [Moorellaceae bacterium]
MLRGLHLTATGMVAQQLRQEVISHNLANADTPGFKAELARLESFPPFLLSRMAGQSVEANIGDLYPGVMVDTLVTDFRPGPLEETGRPTDLALVDNPESAPTFFAVQVGEEVRYTRDGSFRLGPEGILETKDGYPVLGQSGPVRVGEAGWQVDARGGVWLDGALVDNLLVVTFADPQRLQKSGDNLFQAPPDLEATEVAEGTQVKQGFLEKSNLDVVRETVNMLAALRAYEAGQKLVQVQDDLLGKTVNEVGALR